MSFSYNKDTELIAYEINFGDEVGYSCFKVPLKVVEKIDKALLDGEKRDDEKLFKKLREAFFSNTYKIYKGIYVDKEASNEILEKVYDAYTNNSKVLIEYKDGWESYPSEEEVRDGAVVSDDGKTHIVRIGKTTGIKPIFITVNIGASGGESLSFSGIKKIQEIGC